MAPNKMMLRPSRHRKEGCFRGWQALRKLEKADSELCKHRFMHTHKQVARACALNERCSCTPPPCTYTYANTYIMLTSFPIPSTHTHLAARPLVGFAAAARSPQVLLVRAPSPYKIGTRTKACFAPCQPRGIWWTRQTCAPTCRAPSRLH